MSLARIGIDDDHDAPGNACSRLWMDALFHVPTPHETRLEVETRTKVADLHMSGRPIATYCGERQTVTNGRTHARDQIWDMPDGLVRIEDIYQKLRIRVLTDNDPDAALSILQEIRKVAQRSRASLRRRPGDPSSATTPAPRRSIYTV